MSVFLFFLCVRPASSSPLESESAGEVFLPLVLGVPGVLGVLGVVACLLCVIACLRPMAQ